MAIEFPCSNCGQKLRVPDEHAGKIARCPQCQTELPVPAPSAPTTNPFAPSFPSPGLPSQQSAPQPGAGGTLGREPSWYVKTPDGERHGPITQTELDGWRSSGRLNHNCELLQNGWEQWKWADEVFPDLAPRGDFAASSPQGPRPQRPLSSDNPYAASAGGFEPSYAGQRYVKPHRGGLILGLSIGSFFLCILCGIFSLGMSIPAWIMGQADLKEMENGTMDPSGEGTTRAGWILAMIHVILLVVGIVIYAAFIFMVVVAEGNR